jgi:ATP-dependent Lon protease
MGHKAYEALCYARGKFCSQCGKRGHLGVVCRTNPQKRQLNQEMSPEISIIEDDSCQKKIKIEINENISKFEEENLNAQNMKNIEQENSKDLNAKNEKNIKGETIKMSDPRRPDILQMKQEKTFNLW